ncbi:DNA-processing protein DprA [Thermospira aquatica]|uniref:DNA-processing protein DprA n=1 Tax=Thermospira aquatica TaxID=2828656 RepID=A0AAX3BFT6_9SPIR|nr:DNA-processing protein DprA [Thermospira aquatica]URA11061.1 DNA-processing protein DprA [Thermospira aquatica]
MSDNLLLYAALSSNETIGPKRFERILASCGSVERFFELSVEEQMQCVGVSSLNREVFASMLKNGEEILRRCREEGIEVISLEDVRFPKVLREIPDAPFLLYVKGHLLPDFPMVGVVGTRDATPEALEVTRYFCREFVGFGVGVVSGLAQGHDETAHKTVLEYGGYTVAVLGTSFTRVAEHRRELFDALCEHGAVISEYHPFATNQKWRFRFRNRLIAGLSRAVVVMQAPEKSGSLITAEFARLQGRPLFFVPGNPLDPRYAGSNALAKQGGILVALPEDVVHVIYTNPPQKPPPPAQNALPLLTKEEHEIFEKLPVQFSLDSLLEKGEMSVGEIVQLLTQLEVKGYVTQYPGNIYEKRL